MNFPAGGPRNAGEHPPEKFLNRGKLLLVCILGNKPIQGSFLKKSRCTKVTGIFNIPFAWLFFLSCTGGNAFTFATVSRLEIINAEELDFWAIRLISNCNFHIFMVII